MFFLDAIASPSTHPGQWVSGSVMFSDFRDSLGWRQVAKVSRRWLPRSGLSITCWHWWPRQPSLAYVRIWCWVFGESGFVKRSLEYGATDLCEHWLKSQGAFGLVFIGGEVPPNLIVRPRLRTGLPHTSQRSLDFLGNPELDVFT